MGFQVVTSCSYLNKVTSIELLFTKMPHIVTMNNGICTSQYLQVFLQQLGEDLLDHLYQRKHYLNQIQMMTLMKSGSVEWQHGLLRWAILTYQRPVMLGRPPVMKGMVCEYKYYTGSLIIHSAFIYYWWYTALFLSFQSSFCPNKSLVTIHVNV